MDKWLNHPTIVKILALALGILMWAVVHFDPEATPNTVASLTETKVINAVKVQAYGLDERKYVLAGLEPQTVKLTVSGSKKNLLAKAEDYSIKVDLRAVEEGTHTLSLDWNLPRGIDLVEITPRTVQVEVVALQTKEFEASIVTSGSPAEGYKAGTPIIKPNSRVHVTMPETSMALVASVGATINVEGATETLKSKSVKLAAYDRNGNAIENAVIEPAVLEVEIPITNPFKLVPIQFRLRGNMPSGLSIASFKPNIEQVTIYSTLDGLEKVDFIEAEVDLSGITNSGKVTIPLVVDETILEISPNAVEVQIEVVLSETRRLEGLPIEWRGLGQDLIVRILSPESGKADIVVQGAPSILGSLKPGDVDVFADLSGRGPGSYTIPLVVSMERFMRQVGGTKEIVVEILTEEQLRQEQEAAEQDGEANPPEGGGDVEAGTEPETTPPDSETGGGASESPSTGGDDVAAEPSPPQAS